MIGLVRIMNLFVLLCPYTYLLVGFNRTSWEEDYETHGEFSHSYFRGCCHNAGIYLRSGELFPDVVGGAAFIIICRREPDWVLEREHLSGVCIVRFSQGSWANEYHAHRVAHQKNEEECFSYIAYDSLAAQ
jgi:hypothetical protein